MNKFSHGFKAYETPQLALNTGREASRGLKRLRTGLTVTVLAFLALGVLASATSCVDPDDKKAVHDITFSNSVVKELTTDREYKEKWGGLLMEEGGIYVAGIIDITFEEPFYADREWPSLARQVTDINRSPSAWSLHETGTGTYQLKDPEKGKVYDYDFNKSVHSAKSVKKLRVLVYFGDADCVVIVPLAEGE